MPLDYYYYRASQAQIFSFEPSKMIKSLHPEHKIECARRHTVEANGNLENAKISQPHHVIHTELCGRSHTKEPRNFVVSRLSRLQHASPPRKRRPRKEKEAEPEKNEQQALSEK